MGRALLCLLAPLLLIGPALLPGARLLPQLPVGFEPLAAEHPEAAVAAWERANLVTSDRLFPILTDELTIRTELAAGRLPLWEPNFGMGAPLAAGTVAGPWYPPNWLRYAFPPDLAGGLMALVTLWLAGLGMWLLLERLGLVFGAAAVGAVGYQMSGFAAVNLHYVMKVDAALWLPWALWAVEGVYTRRRRAGLWLSLSIGFALLAGFPQIGVFTAAATLLYILWRLVATDGEEREPGLCARALACVALGFGLAAVQLIPMAEASRHAVRQPQSAEALWPQRLPVESTASIAAPNIFFHLNGNDQQLHRQQLHRVFGQISLPAPGFVNSLEWTFGGGSSLLLLSFFAILVRRRRSLFPLLLGLGAVGFAQGWPIVRGLYYLPGLDLGSPARASAVGWIALPWLAAICVDFLITEANAERQGFIRWGLLLLGLALLGLAMFPITGMLMAATYPFTVAPAFMGVACWLMRGRKLTRELSLSWLGPVAVLLISGWITGREHLVPRQLPADRALFPVSPAMEAIREAAGDGRVLRFDASDSGIDDVLVLARPNLPHGYGIADLTPYLVFTNARLVQLFERMDPRTRFRSGISRVADPAQLGHPLLDLARVTCVLARRPLEHPRLELTFEREGFFVYRRSGALPVARGVAGALTVESDATAIGMLASGTVPLASTTVLGPEASRAAGLAGNDLVPGGEVRVVEITRPSPGRLDVRVEADGPGLVAFTEAWMPGWTATVNGEPAPLVRADHVARAVPVPAGTSVVRTRYAPPSLNLGLIVTLLSLALAIWLDRGAKMRPGSESPGSPQPGSPQPGSA